MAFIIGLLLGCWLGWVRAHYTIAAECRQLGGFFVGDETFRCISRQADTTTTQPDEVTHE